MKNDRHLRVVCQVLSALEPKSAEKKEQKV
jgi:hypothetical protein